MALYNGNTGVDRDATKISGNQFEIDRVDVKGQKPNIILHSRGTIYEADPVQVKNGQLTEKEHDV